MEQSLVSGTALKRASRVSRMQGVSLRCIFSLHFPILMGIISTIQENIANTSAKEAAGQEMARSERAVATQQQANLSQRPLTQGVPGGQNIVREQAPDLSTQLPVVGSMEPTMAGGTALETASKVSLLQGVSQQK